MGRPSLSVLAARCRVSELEVPIGSEWRHYKGDVYEVVGFGVSEKTGEIEVEYVPAQPLSAGDPLIPLTLREMGPDVRGLKFHRSLKEWRERIQVSEGQLMSPEKVAELTPEQKLEAANALMEVNRYERVFREEVWSDAL